MIKVGLYLSAEPGGGAFQYNLAMLAAVASLPRHEFEAVIAYSFDLWRPYLAQHRLKTIYVPNTGPSRFVAGAWHRLGLSLGLWRRIARRLHPFCKVLVDERCALWIFPTQDSWPYRVPVPALGVIYDLMHRYETRFPEVSEHGEYRRRERHYRRLSRWAKGILVDSQIGKQHARECYDVPDGRLHVLPFVPPAHIFSQHTPADFDERYPLPERFILYPAQFW